MLHEGSGGKLVNANKKTTEITFNTITQVVFSKSFYGQKVRGRGSQGTQKDRDVEELMDEITIVAGKFSISEFFPWLHPLDLGGVQRSFRSLRNDFSDFITQVLDERRHNDTRGENAPRDVTNKFLELQKTDGDNYTEDVILANLAIILIGGTDTSSGQMIWMLSEILRHPEVKQKLLEELDTVIGRERFVGEADLDKLPYLQAVLKESFRLHPIAPLRFPHYSSEATTLAGFEIPKNARVIFNVYSIGRNPEVWENPTKFDPSRFVNRSVDDRVSDSSMLLFGAGRACPGASMAATMLSLAVAQILHACDVRLPEGMKPEDLDVEEEYGMLTHRKNALQLRLSPRLPHHVYTAAGISL